MAVVDTNPQQIDGPWIEGFVLDRHVISARPLGYLGDHMQFDTTRSALGELIYQLKYRNGSADDIIDTAAAFVTERWPGRIDCIVTPPPSLHRATQPMRTIAAGLAARLGIPVLADAVAKATATQQMKNVPLDEREPLLGAAIQAGTEAVERRRVLVVDDLWETGSTLRRVAEVLTARGAAEIRALAMTRTK
jgi:predicted amidophosphoribosyltransferase